MYFSHKTCTYGTALGRYLASRQVLYGFNKNNKVKCESIASAANAYYIILHTPLPRLRRPSQNTPIRALRVSRVIRNLAHTLPRLCGRVPGALEHAAISGGHESFQDVAEHVAHTRDGLALGDRLVDLDQALDEASELGVCVVEGVGDVRVGEVGLDGGVAGRDVQVHHDAVDEVDGAVDQRCVPDLGLAHLDCQAGNAVVDKGRLDAAWLAGVDLQCVGLEKFAQTLHVRQAPISIAPEACVTAG